jgi:hypothetical protein
MTATTPAADPKAPPQGRVQHWAVVIGAAATVLGTTIALLAYCAQRDGTGADPVADRTITATPPATPPGPPPAPPPSRDTGLAVSTLELYGGGSRLKELPRDLAGDSTLSDALVIGCPSNQSDDLVSEVTFETALRYHSFRATVRAYHESGGSRSVRLTVFPDPQDLRPGAVGGGAATEMTFPFGQTRAMTADIEGAFYLRLRVECDLPDGYVFLIGAEVVS